MDDFGEDLKHTIIEIQDFLSPLLDSYEQMIYHYLFRHTRLVGIREIVIGTRVIQSQVGHGMGKGGSPPSQRIISDKVRSLGLKGCVKVIERSNRGTRLEVLLPREIPDVVKSVSTTKALNIDELDFYSTSILRLTILERDSHKCFYCLRSISPDNFSLDHVNPRSATEVDNSYRNLVACCWECNSRKQTTDAHAFVRRLYRDGFLNVGEHQDRIRGLEDLAAGKLVPDISKLTGSNT